MGQYASMNADETEEVPAPESPKPSRRRMTKAEKEQHQLEMMKSLATLQDLEDEKRHRRRNTWIGGAALLVTAVFSLASCSVTQSEVRTMDNIAEQQQARDRDQLRLRCVELVAESTGPILTLVMTIEEAGATSIAAGTGVAAPGTDPAAMADVTADFAKVAAVCSAAGLTDGAAKGRYSDSLSGMAEAITGTLEDQRAAVLELFEAHSEYIEVDVTAVGSIFETETGSGEPSE